MGLSNRLRALLALARRMLGAVGLADVLFVVGFVALVRGVALLSVAVAWIVAGALVLAAAVITARTESRGRLR